MDNSPNNSKNLALLASLSLALFAGYMTPVYAAFHPTAEFNAMMANVLTTLPAVVRLVFAIAYVMGIWFIYSAIKELKAFGEAHNSKPSSASVTPSLIRLFVGSMLLFAPGLIDISTYSLWGYGADSIIQYSTGAESTMGWGPVLKGTEALIRVIGYISFLRGMFKLAKAAKGNSGPKDTVGKGLTHIIGGILAINIVGTISIIKATLGLSSGI